MLKLPTRVTETLQVLGVPRSTKAGGIYVGDRLATAEELVAILGISVKSAERMQRMTETRR